MSILFIGVLILTVVFLVITLFYLLLALVSGLRIKEKNGDRFAYHKRHVTYFIWSLVPLIVMVKFLVYLHGGRWGSHWLFVAHMSLVVCFLLVLVAMRCIWTGKENAAVHRVLSKVFMISFVLMVGSGVWLSSQLFIS